MSMIESGGEGRQEAGGRRAGSWRTKSSRLEPRKTYQRHANTKHTSVVVPTQNNLAVHPTTLHNKQTWLAGWLAGCLADSLGFIHKFALAPWRGVGPRRQCHPNAEHARLVCAPTPRLPPRRRKQLAFARRVADLEARAAATPRIHRAASSPQQDSCRDVCTSGTIYHHMVFSWEFCLYHMVVGYCGR